MSFPSVHKVCMNAVIHVYSPFGTVLKEMINKLSALYFTLHYFLASLRTVVMSVANWIYSPLVHKVWYVCEHSWCGIMSILKKYICVLDCASCA